MNNSTQISLLKSKFLFDRASYLFGTSDSQVSNDSSPDSNNLPKCIELLKSSNYRINIFNSGDWLQNLRLSLGDNFLLPFLSRTEAIQHPLTEVEYMRVNREEVRKLIEVRQAVEDKMNQKFRERGLKVIDVDYMQYLDRIATH